MQKKTPMQLWAEANPHLAKQSAIRKMRKDGQITKEVAAKLLKANYEDRKASITKAAKGSTGQRSTTTKSTNPAPVQPQRSQQANTGTGRNGKFGTGTYGKGRPSNNNRSQNPEAIAARNQRQRILERYPATGVYKNAANQKQAQKALDKRYGTGDKPKQQPTPTKPKRSSFPVGRSGATAYAAALAKYRKLLASAPKVPREYNRRGRPI